MAEIRVPTLGESVTEATIGKWFKKAGDAVAVDEPLVELETDKVTIEVPAPAAGVLTDVAAKDGETVAVGALLGAIKEGAGAVPAGRPDQKTEQAKASRRRPGTAEAEGRRRRRSRAAAKTARRGDMPLAPSVRKIAAETGIDAPPSPAPARTAASPRATCWPPSSARRRSRRRSPQPAAAVQARAPVAARRRRARGARAHDAAAPDHRAPAQGGAEHRRHAHDLQRGRHDAR